MRYLKRFLESKRVNNLIDTLFHGNFPKVNELADKISKEFGYNITKKIGEGDWGIAYLLNDDKVLKLTVNKKEVLYAFKFLNKHTRYLVNYYNCVEINYSGKIFWALVLDYVHPLSDTEKKIYSLIQIHFDQYGDLIQSNISTQDFEAQIEDFIIEMRLTQGTNFDTDDIKNVFYKVRNIAKEVKKSKIVEPWEMHLDNLGKNKFGDWVYFDITAITVDSNSMKKIKRLVIS